jgi:parallel beta-helix repeat protein
MDYQLIYAQEKLEIQGDLEINSPSAQRRSGLILRPQPLPPTGEPGQISYDSGTRQPYYYDGSGWKPFVAGTDKAVATRIVAAYNSLGSKKSNGDACEAGSTDCQNERADYTCDGTDDQVWIQKAIDDLPDLTELNAKQGMVYLLEGVFNISASLLLKSGTTLVGTGANTVLMAATAGTNIISAGGSGLLISQLKIDGNDSKGLNGIYLNDVDNSKISGIWIERMSGYGIELDNGSLQNEISDNFLQSNTGGGIHILQANSDMGNIITRNQVFSNGNGIFIEGAAGEAINAFIAKNNVQSNTATGIRLSFNSKSIISENIIESNAGHGILLESSEYCTVSGNNVERNGALSSGTPIPSDITLSSGGHNIISTNNILTINHYGIYLYNSRSNSVTENIYYKPNTNSYDAIKIEGSDNFINANSINTDGGSGSGIYITGANLNNYLGSNYITYYNTPIKDGDTGSTTTNTKYLNATRMTLERKPLLMVSSNTITLSYPTAYVPLQGVGGPVTVDTISPGKPDADIPFGDMLILEGTHDTNTVTIQNTGNVKFRQGITSRQLGLDDTLTLFWNGTKWVEIKYANN